MSLGDVEAFRQALERAEHRAGVGNAMARRDALSALRDLESPTSKEPQHFQFLSLCRHVVDGFQGLSDEQIAGADETPELMRYLISAMRSYVARTGDSRLSASERYKRLAEAFCAAGAHGGDRRSLWTEERERRVVVTYSVKLHEQADPRTRAARVVATQVAYDEAFGPDTETGRDQREQMKNLRQLIPLLVSHGYLWDGAFD